MRCVVKCIKQEAHEEGVWTCCWVPGTRSILTGSVDETVRRWASTEDEIELEKTYCDQAGYMLGVVSVAADHTGQWAASSALDSYVRVWSLQDHQEKALLESMPTEVWSIQFSPLKDRCIVAAAGGTSGKVKLWDVTDMTPGIKSPVPDPTLLDVPKQSKSGENPVFVLSTAMSPDGKSLACGGMDGQISVFDLETGQVTNTLVGQFKPVRSLTFTPDSKKIISACDDFQIRLHETSGNLIDAFSGHESWALSVSARPDGLSFASGSSDNSVRIWDIGQRACVLTSKEHKDQVWCVAYSDDGSELASCGDDGRLVTYSVIS